MTDEHVEGNWEWFGTKTVATFFGKHTITLLTDARTFLRQRPDLIYRDLRSERCENKSNS